MALAERKLNSWAQMKKLPPPISWTYTRDLFGGLIMDGQKDVFRLTGVIVLFAGLFGMWTSGG